MSKPSIAAALVCFSLSVGCAPPDAPPPRFRPNPPYAPTSVDPYAQSNDVSPSPEAVPQTPPAPAGIGNYPAATKTANPNQVLSPYEPFNVIDVEGFTSGQLARDPSNQKIFRIP